MQRKNAVFDQSPSTTVRRGRRKRCPPGIAYAAPFFGNSICDSRSASSVIATYAADSSGPVTLKVLSPARRGSAMSRPEMYCEDTLPAIS